MSSVEGRPHFRHRHTGDRRFISGDDTNEPCTNNQMMSINARTHWIRSLGLLNGDASNLLQRIGCRFDKINCKVPEFANNSPSRFTIKVACASAYTSSVSNSLRDFQTTFETIKMSIDHFQASLVLDINDPLAALSNVLLNDIASSLSTFADKTNQINSSSSSTTQISSSAAMYMMYTNALNDFKIFLRGALSSLRSLE